MTDPQIEPGKPLTNNEKLALAKDNERESRRAYDEAARQREIDARMGPPKDPVKIVAENLAERLRREDFTRGTITRS